MSVSKWRYTEACDGMPCVGDCDFCSFDPEEPELCLPYEGERRNYDGKGVTVEEIVKSVRWKNETD